MAAVPVKLVELLQRQKSKLRRLLAPVTTEPVTTEPIDIADIQGLVLRGYGNLPYCCYALLQVREASEARVWVGRLASEISNGEPAARQQALQVAFTHRGLAALGLPAALLRGFSAEFINGMTEAHKSRFLGDEGDSAPARWVWGGPQNPSVHAVLMLYAASAAQLDELLERQRQAWSRDGWVEVHLLQTGRLSEREHFGFVDGISQPAIDGYHKADSPMHRVKAGEFLLGYPNEYGLYTDRPLIDAGEPAAAVLPDDVEGSGRRDFGRNGTYLVMRQLPQNVAAFRGTLDRLTENPDGSSNAEASARLAAQMVGRWPSGAPLVATPWRDEAAKAKENEFGYHRDDPDGLLCPLGAHVRRANPRDSLAPQPGTEASLAVNRRHRLLRRGRVYGPPLAPGAIDSADRGLIFVALNANIVRQFEFVQHSWLMDPRFHGFFGEADPLVGTLPDNCFTVQGNPLRRRFTGLSRFVNVAGGAYFFMPGIRALRFIAALSPQNDTKALSPQKDGE